jgi:soluble lytic murein transglycosylase
MSVTSRAQTARAEDRRRGTRRSVFRRRMVALGAFIALIVAAVLIAPLARRTIRHFTLPLEYSAIIRQQAAEKHLDPALIAAVIYAETRFRPRTSPTGAKGLMQIEPYTAEFLARRSGASTFTVADLGTPQVNIAYGSYYLHYLMDEYGGSKVLALAAYNGGETNVDDWLRTARARHQNFTIGAIPISQTRAYVTEVLSKQRAYRSSYASQLGYS